MPPRGLKLDRFCANEEDYHQRVIHHMASFPDSLKTRPGLQAFVWGHEVDLHDAGRGGGDGSADLFTVDEEGMVWLIEAKFDKTFERGEFVWGNQLARYRNAIAKMEWQDILIYVRKFLRWGEKTKPGFQIPESTETFARVLELWQNTLGRALIRPDELNNRIAARLKYGTYGIMILTDIDDESYARFGSDFEHDGPLSYVQGVPVADGMDYRVRWYRPASRQEDIVAQREVWTSTFDPVPKQLCAPEYFAEGLSQEARTLWLDSFRPGLTALGWSAGKISPMGFEARFEINGKSIPLLLIGWPERDDKNVPRDEKKFGGASIRIDIHIKRIYEASGFEIGVTNKWMKRFYDLGWRGRPSKGMDKRWGIESVTDDELKSRKLQGIMRYRPRDTISCHNGRVADAASLTNLLTELSEFLGEVRALAARTVTGSASEHQQ